MEYEDDIDPTWMDDVRECLACGAMFDRQDIALAACDVCGGILAPIKVPE